MLVPFWMGLAGIGVLGKRARDLLGKSCVTMGTLLGAVALSNGEGGLCPFYTA